MLEAVRDVDTADDSPRKHARFLSRGSSLGGARQKATTEYDGKQWIGSIERSQSTSPNFTLS